MYRMYMWSIISTNRSNNTQNLNDLYDTVRVKLIAFINDKNIGINSVYIHLHISV